MLVRLYQEASFPTAGGRYFMARPVAIDGPEAEGGAAALAADEAATIPVLVVGARIPAPGDVLVAHAVGGRWVAESGGSPGDLCGIACPACGGALFDARGTFTDGEGNAGNLDARSFDFGDGTGFSLAWFSGEFTRPTSQGIHCTTDPFGVVTCALGPGTLGYQYAVKCVGNKVRVYLLTNPVGCESPLVNPNSPGWRQDAPTWPVVKTIWSGDAEVTCDPSGLSGSITFNLSAACFSTVVFHPLDTPAGPFEFQIPSLPRQPQVCCYPCPLPKRDLRLSWVNPLIGDGSVTLAYSAPGTWASGCTHGLLYWLSCAGGSLQFGVTYFLSGSCPGGQQQTCSSAGSNPFALKLQSARCKPLELVYQVSPTGCPVLSSGGYLQYTVDAP